jgi:hypothetical protein
MTEIAKVPSTIEEVSPGHKMRCAPSATEEDILRIKNIADKVAHEVSTVSWSTYCKWKMVSSLKATDLAGQVAEYQSLWNNPSGHPQYGTCVDTSYLWMVKLRQRLKNSQLDKFAREIKLLACRASDGEVEHVIAALPLGSSMILIDNQAYSYGHIFQNGVQNDLRQSVTFRDTAVTAAYKYLCDTSGNYALVYISGNTASAEDIYMMTEITWEEAIKTVTFARARQQTKHYYNISQACIKDKPAGIPYEKTNDGYCIEMCKISTYNDTKSIAILVPLAAWLQKSGNLQYLTRASEAGVEVKTLKNYSVVEFKLAVNNSKGVEVLRVMVQHLGIEQKVFLNMVDDVKSIIYK